MFEKNEKKKKKIIFHLYFNDFDQNNQNKDLYTYFQSFNGILKLIKVMPIFLKKSKSKKKCHLFQLN